MWWRNNRWRGYEEFVPPPGDFANPGLRNVLTNSAFSLLIDLPASVHKYGFDCVRHLCRAYSCRYTAQCSWHPFFVGDLQNDADVSTRAPWRDKISPVYFSATAANRWWLLKLQKTLRHVETICSCHEYTKNSVEYEVETSFVVTGVSFFDMCTIMSLMGVSLKLLNNLWTTSHEKTSSQKLAPLLAGPPCVQ